MQELVAKSIESSDLNFSRYGDTFFEASFLMPGGFDIDFLFSEKRYQFGLFISMISKY